MKKIFWVIAYLGSASTVGIFLGMQTRNYLNERNQTRITLLLAEVDSLVKAKYELCLSCIPDSIANLSRTASYELMYVEYESNDYWKYKADIRFVSDYAIKHCPNYREICLSIKEKEEKINNLTQKQN